MADQNMGEQPQGQAAPKSGRKKTMIMGGAMLGLMVVEALVVFVVVKKFTGGPEHAAGAQLPGLEVVGDAKRVEDVELEVAKLRAQNERSQRQITYSLEVFIRAAEEDKDKLTEALEKRKATVQDRLTRVIRAAEPERFTEPDLRTLRKQFQTELSTVVGDDKLIKEVLIPSIESMQD